TVFVNLDQRLIFAGLSCLLWFCALGGTSSERLRRHGATVIPLFVAMQVLVALRSGGDWMPGWRYMMAAVPLWTLLIVLGIAEVAQATARRWNRIAAAVGIASI